VKFACVFLLSSSLDLRGENKRKDFLKIDSGTDGSRRKKWINSFSLFLSLSFGRLSIVDCCCDEKLKNPHAVSLDSIVSLYLPKKIVDQEQLLDEDSSYDSDNEVTTHSSSHPNVSRNVSETLGQELDDYNSVSIFFF
jgi:hypothetical protein